MLQAGVEPPTHCCACKHVSQCLCTLCMNTSGMVFSVPHHKHIMYKVMIWVVLQRCVPKVGHSPPKSKIADIFFLHFNSFWVKPMGYQNGPNDTTCLIFFFKWMKNNINAKKQHMDPQTYLYSTKYDPPHFHKITCVTQRTMNGPYKPNHSYTLNKAHGQLRHA